MKQDTIGGYTILRRICQTASSEIYLARDLRGRSDVALKVILPQMARDKKTLRNYAREAEISSELEHPSLAKIYEFVEKAERPYLVMKFAPGQTLKRVIYREPELLVGRGMKWLAHSAEALGYMHKHGYVHLDVKPENILVDVDGRAVVIDLAIAQRTGPRTFMESLKLKLSHETAGTRSYMSPEQIENRPYTAAADIYSFGIIIFELYARRLPLTASDPDAILQLHLRAKPPLLHSVVPNIHPDLSRLVARMLEKSPEARPQSMEAVIEALARIGQPFISR